VTNGRRAQVLAWVLGMVIFIESTITVLVAGSICRPLFDRFRVSREKLAYLIDSTSAPVCTLIPFNAWGAFLLSLLIGAGVEPAVPVLVAAVPLNFYALAAIGVAFVAAVRTTDVGPMAKAQRRTEGGVLHWEHAVALADPEDIAPPPKEGAPLRAVNMVLPIAVMVAMMPLAMYVTGGGDLLAGSGSLSVLWAVLAGIAAAGILSRTQGILDIDELTDVSLHGAGGLAGMALVLLLAVTLGAVTQELGTGQYLAGLVQGAVPIYVLLPLIFLTGAGISFATGSSWGTFAIMIPIAVPVAIALDLPIAPFLAASMSGGVFGDHTSPISDTTIISSLASASDHIEHVRTQMPYAFIAGGIALVGFAITGAVI
jgi:Na+/H+ antiporter NhaC